LLAASVAALKSVENRPQRWDLVGLPAGADDGGDRHVAYTHLTLPTKRIVWI